MTILTAPGGGHTRQPQYPARLNLSNNLLRGSTPLAVITGSVGRNLADGAALVVNGVVVPKVEAQGAGFYTGVGAKGDIGASIVSAGSSIVTDFLYGYYTGSTGSFNYFMGDYDGVNGSALRLDDGTSWAWYNGTGLDTPSPPDHLTFGTLYTFVCVRDTVSGAFKVYRDGALKVSSSSFKASTANWAVGAVGKNYWSSANGSETNTLLAGRLLNRAWSAAEVSQFTANPWQILQAPPRRIFLPSATVQFLRPASDISAGAWTPSTGVSLFGTINETPFNDITYNTTPSASTFEVKLGAGAAPGVTTGHTIRYRAKGTGSLTVRLIQGTTVIATNNPSITAAYQTFIFTLSGAEAAAITDYTDLRLRFTST